VLLAKPAPIAEDAAAAAPRRVRFGLTVGKRFARRAVDRARIKRVLREAARHCAPQLALAARSDLDIVLRLKAPLPARATTSLRQLKRALREDADALLARLLARLSAPRPAG
jgi:ribonuclease P protein component